MEDTYAIKEVEYERRVYYVLSEVVHDRIIFSVWEPDGRKDDGKFEHWDLLLDSKLGWLGHVLSRMEEDDRPVDWPSGGSYKVIEAAYPELKGAPVHKGKGQISIGRDEIKKHNLGVPLREYIVEPEVSPIPKEK